MRAFFANTLPENPWLLAMLLGFVALFAAMTLWVYRPERRADLEKESNLPLQD